MSILVVLVFGYLLGSFSPALWLARYKLDIDLREKGSGNLGTLNVWRILGWRYALITLAFDLGKGYLAVSMGRWLGGGLLLWAGLAGVIAGHNFSLFAGFTGGKGLAAAGGGLLALSPGLFLGTAGAGLATLAISGNLYLAAIALALAFPVLVALTVGTTLPVIGGATIVSALVLSRHSHNIRDMATGERPLVRSRHWALLASFGLLVGNWLGNGRRLGPIAAAVFPLVVAVLVGALVALVAVAWLGRDRCWRNLATTLVVPTILAVVCGTLLLPNPERLGWLVGVWPQAAALPVRGAARLRLAISFDVTLGAALAIAAWFGPLPRHPRSAREQRPRGSSER
ncbi:MAG: glycerol-3-phosphate acyltransferase [Bacillota bacterium]